MYTEFWHTHMIMTNVSVSVIFYYTRHPFRIYVQ